MVSKSQDSSGKVDGFSVDVLIVRVNRKIVRLMVSNRSCLVVLMFSACLGCCKILVFSCNRCSLDVIAVFSFAKCFGVCFRKVF